MKIERYKNDLARLIHRGETLYLAMLVELSSEEDKPKFKLSQEQRDKLPIVSKDYQSWYSEALACVQQILPDRAQDFVAYYKPARERKELNAGNYTVSDYLKGLAMKHGERMLVGPESAIPALNQQIQIVKGLSTRFESSLFDIRLLVQADFLDDELSAAEELLRNGYSRAAGALAGVALEEHLVTVAARRKLAYRTNASIGDLNDALKNGNALDTPTWRFIQRLGDLINFCSHKKTQDPTNENVKELIDGVKKIIKTIF